MTEYVNKVSLEVNGRSITDFKSASEPEREIFKQVPVMDGTGYARMTQRYAPITVQYVVPKDASEFDWEAVENGRLTIERQNGKRITYTGVYVLKIGEAKADGENEMDQTIELGAVNRIVE